MKQPSRGGRYRREQDGTLTRLDAAPTAAPAETVAPVEPKPAKAPKRKVEK